MKKHFKSANAFTVLELLVVITVVAILAALLFPVFKSAKDRAIRTVCLNNLRQINLGVRMYGDDSNDVPPTPGKAAGATNPITLYSGYKALMKSYVGLPGEASSRDKLFACPADMFYPPFFSTNEDTHVRYVRESLHDTNYLDYSSYAFNGGDNVIRMLGTIPWTRPGLTGVKLSSVKKTARTVLVAEAAAFVPWSWHEPGSRRPFNNAKNIVSFVEGHVSYIKIYWDSTPLPDGGLTFALAYDPPAGYDYQWSGN